jgi:protein-S-isoprenylcysteine O-methyltransferase Ste14
MPSLRINIIVSASFALFGGPGLILVYFPWSMTRFHIPAGEPLWQIAIAGALIAAGLVPLLESILRFIVVGRGTLVPTTPTEHLVVSGFYCYVRNPMYVGVLTVIAGEALLFRSRSLVDYLAIVWLLIHLFVFVYEEPKLTRAFPDQYPRYRSHVRRWLPRLAPWNASEVVKPK